jgi:intracellular multiplication protein IcmP
VAGEKGGNDGIFLFLFLMAVVWGGGWLVWKNFRTPLTGTILTVRAAQMDIASLWMDDTDIINVPMPTSTDDEKPLKAKLGDNERIVQIPAPFGVWREFAKTAKPENTRTDHLRVLSYVSLYSWRWPTIAGFLALFGWVLFRGPTSLFRRVLGLETLLRDQAKMFKVIQPFIKFNPNTLPVRAPGQAVQLEQPLFGEALSPEEWIAVNQIAIQGTTPDPIAAERAFAKQLGPRWEGADKLPAELKVLLAAFCLKASRKRNESDEMLGRLMGCWDHEKGMKLSRDRALLRESKKILRDKKLSDRVLTNCNRHAYVSTALIRGLNTAREEGGVLAPATFLWLRGHNRALWYPLNNLGRQAFHMEALGVMSHYRAEKQVNRPILKPKVKDAVDGLQEFQTNKLLVRDIPPLDHGKTRKKKKA